MKNVKTVQSATHLGKGANRFLLAAAVISLLSFSTACTTRAYAEDADAQTDNNDNSTQVTAPANPTYGGAIAPAPVDSGATAPDQNANAQGNPDQGGNQNGGQAAGMAADALQKLNNMSPQQRAQLVNQGQAAMQGMSQQDIDAMKAKLAAQWQAMTPEQQQALQAQLLENASVSHLQQYVLDHTQNVPPEARQVIIDAVKKSGQPPPPAPPPFIPPAQ